MKIGFDDDGWAETVRRARGDEDCIVVQELGPEEYLEFMFLRWYYGHMQSYVNDMPFEHKDYDTFQEWIIDYYEHPGWGSNFKLKAPESYRKAAKDKLYAHQGKD